MNWSAELKQARDKFLMHLNALEPKLSPEKIKEYTANVDFYIANVTALIKRLCGTDEIDINTSFESMLADKDASLRQLCLNHIAIWEQDLNLLLTTEIRKIFNYLFAAVQSGYLLLNMQLNKSYLSAMPGLAVSSSNEFKNATPDPRPKYEPMNLGRVSQEGHKEYIKAHYRPSKYIESDFELSKDYTRFKFETANLKGKYLYKVYFRLVPVNSPEKNFSDLSATDDLSLENKSLYIEWDTIKKEKRQGFQVARIDEIPSQGGEKDDLFLIEKEPVFKKVATGLPRRKMEFENFFDATKKPVLKVPHLTLNYRREYEIACNKKYRVEYQIWGKDSIGATEEKVYDSRVGQRRVSNSLESVHSQSLLPVGSPLDEKSDSSAVLKAGEATPLVSQSFLNSNSVAFKKQTSLASGMLQPRR